MTSTKGTFKVEHLTSTTMTMLGKAPFYDCETMNLYYCDVMGGQIFRFDTANCRTHTARILGETLISFIVPVHGTNNQFIIGAGKRMLLITWDGTNSMAHITRVLTELPMNGLRFNTAMTDAHGRLFCGTMLTEETGHLFDTSKRLGSLYKFTMTEGLTELKTKVGFSNGICFNDKTNAMYYVDSYDLNIKQFGYDIKTGTISGEKMMCDLTSMGASKTNFPTGLTMDTEGNLYCAMFGSGKILKINTTTGKVMTEIAMPVTQCASICFGGKNMDTMFCTTAGMDILATQTYPAGYLFKVTGMGTHGTEMTKFKTH